MTGKRKTRPPACHSRWLERHAGGRVLRLPVIGYQRETRPPACHSRWLERLGCWSVRTGPKEQVHGKHTGAEMGSTSNLLSGRWIRAPTATSCTYRASSNKGSKTLREHAQDRIAQIRSEWRSCGATLPRGARFTDDASPVQGKQCWLICSGLGALRAQASAPELMGCPDTRERLTASIVFNAISRYWSDCAEKRLVVPLHGAQSVRIEMSLGALVVSHESRITRIRLGQSCVIKVHGRRAIDRMVSRVADAPRERPILGVGEARVLVAYHVVERDDVSSSHVLGSRC